MRNSDVGMDNQYSQLLTSAIPHAWLPLAEMLSGNSISATKFASLLNFMFACRIDIRVIYTASEERIRIAVH